MDWKALAEPFPAEDIEWRIGQKGAKDGKAWAKVLAYVTNRAIMQRLDDVVGPPNWRNEFQHIQGAFLCGLSIRVDGEWVTKWDGAQESQIEATKGGISGAMKRAAVQWGIGRYLYDLDEGWAVVGNHGDNYCPADNSKGVPAFKWSPPQLPAWALPKNRRPQEEKRKPVTEDPPAPTFIKWPDVKTELEGVFSLDELKQVWANRYPMMKHHYKAKELRDAEAVKNEMKAKLTNRQFEETKQKNIAELKRDMPH